MRRYRDLTEKEREHCKRWADPHCPKCDGEGWMPVSWNGDPDRCEDLACDCVRNDEEFTDEDARTEVV